MNYKSALTLMKDTRIQSTLSLFYILLAFLLSRLVIIITGYLGQALFLATNHDQTILDLFCKWDCGWYMPLIQNGYDMIPQGHENKDAANWAFFPAFPLASRFTSIFFSIPYLTAAYLVSNISFLFALIFFYKYTALTLSKQQTIFATYLFAFFPYSFYFSIPYTEGLFTLLLIAVFYFSATNRWLLAGIAAALLSATRNIGVFIIFPMLIIAIQQFGFRKLLRLEADSIKAIFAILIAPLGLFLYMFFLYLHVGDPLAFSHVQVAWGHKISNPLKYLTRGLLSFDWPAAYLASFAIASIICGILLLKIKRYSEGIMTLIFVLIPASAGVASPRYCVVAFPIYIYLALIVKSTKLQYIMLAIAIILNSFLVLAWITAKNFMV